MSDWFEDHYHEAPAQIVEFLGGDGISITGKVVADIGCGDGIIDLGLAHRTSPARLTGFDIRLTNAELLGDMARQHGVPPIPDSLEFRESEPVRLPAPDDSYDLAISWSAFEHVAEPEPVFREIRRVLRPHGVFFMQIWPLYYSEHGGHLWDWFTEPFPHLLYDDDHIASVLTASDHPQKDYMLDEYRHLNGATIDDLQLALRGAGLAVRKLELLSSAVHIPPALADVPLSKLGITGVKLLATPA